MTNKRNKNISKTIPNGTLVITKDNFIYGTDKQSEKTRMTVTVDSNRKNEIAITKYTTSNRHGRSFENDKGFKRHGDRIFVQDDEGNPIHIDGIKFIRGSKKRSITPKQANEIKRRNLKETKYNKGNSNALRKLKGRGNKKRKQ